MSFKKFKKDSILSLLSLAFYLWPFIFSLFLSGCGYTTRGFFYNEKKIFIPPIKNNMDITSEERRNSNYTTYPVLLEKQLTNYLIDRFNTDGYLKVVKEKEGALKLSCSIAGYEKDTVRRTDTDSVEEQRLRLFVNMELKDSQGEILKNKTVVGETSYYLSGSRQKSEESARLDLIEDTARRITEVVIEEW